MQKLNKNYRHLTLIFILLLCGLKPLSAQKSPLQLRMDKIVQRADSNYTAGHIDKAQALYAEASAVYIERNDALTSALLLARVASCQVILGQLQTAYATTAQAHQFWSQTEEEDWNPIELRTYYNSMGYAYLQVFRDYEKAVLYFERSIATCEREACEAGMKVEIHLNYATALYNQGKLLAAESTYHEGLALIEAMENPYFMYPMVAYMGLVTVENELGKFTDTQHTYNKLRAVLTSANQTERFSWLYNSMADHFLYQGLYEEAMRYAKEALRLESKKPDPLVADVIEFRATLAKAFENMGQFDSAIVHHHKNLALEKEVFGLDHPNLAYSYNGLGNGYLRQKNDSAWYFFEKSVALTAATEGKESMPYSIALLNLSEAYAQLGEFEKSLALLEDAEAICISLQGPNSIRSLETSLAKASALLTSGQLDRARQVLLEVDQRNRRLANYSEVRLSYYSPMTHLKSLALQFELEVTKNRSTSEAQLSESADSLYWQLQTDVGQLMSNLSPFENREQAWAILKDAFEVYLAHHYQDKSQFLDLLTIAETFKYKPAVSRMSRKMAVEEQQVLKDSLVQLEQEMNSLSLMLMEQQVNQDSVQTLLFSNQEAYVNLVYDINQETEQAVFDQQTVINNLEDEYFIGFYQAKEQLYVFTAYGQKKEILSLPLSAIAQDIAAFKSECSRPSSQGKQIITGLGHRLYQQLQFPDSDIDIKRLLISAHGSLQAFPFDALLTAPVENHQISYSEMPVLIKKHQVIISPSLAMPKAMNTEFDAQNASIYYPEIALNGNKQPAPIRGAIEEAAMIKAVYSEASTQVNTEKDKGFYEELGQSGILHFATHGWVNPQSPEMSYLLITGKEEASMADKGLFAFEIANIPFKAGLVFLSSCETGKVAQNPVFGFEHSLAASFLVGGAQRVIFSTQKVNDFHTSKLVEAFYQQMSEGESVAATLQQAKLDYLSSSPDLSAHPFYWAHFKLYDNTQLKASSGYLPWLLLAAGLVVLAVLLKRYRKAQVLAG